MFLGIPEGILVFSIVRSKINIVIRVYLKSVKLHRPCLYAFMMILGIPEVILVFSIGISKRNNILIRVLVYSRQALFCDPDPMKSLSLKTDILNARLVLLIVLGPLDNIWDMAINVSNCLQSKCILATKTFSTISSYQPQSTDPEVATDSSISPFHPLAQACHSSMQELGHWKRRKHKVWWSSCANKGTWIALIHGI